MTMVPGYNTDFKYRGETYHVQTEDNGVANPVVVTLLYHKGAILASQRTPYHDIAGKPGFEKELTGIMKNQHKELMRALLSGAYDMKGAAPAAAGGTGEHPAVAAAAICGSPAPKPAESAPQRGPVVAARPVPEQRCAPPRTAAAPVAAPTLDDAIRAYLESFAATTAAAVN
jgi:hypothetical protein